MRKYIVECIGTFFLVLTIGLNVMGGNTLAPLAIGSVLMVMVFAGGHVSGGHYNPAVTFAVWLRGKCSSTDMPIYMGAQLIGAYLAALIAPYLLADPVRTAPHLDKARALLAEFLFTFGLCYVVLNVATAKGTSGNSFYGLAIGFTVMVGAFSVGKISGGVFNPAVGVGICVMGLALWESIWIYL
ncbi:MAG TPA: aquaporin, partial [Gemmataceae bacterium]|nr:aquaporin [Gemmataceae bacterium]